MSRRKNDLLPLSPSWMPLIVERIYEGFSAAMSVVDAMGDFGRELQDFPKSALWYVDRDMTALAVDTAEDKKGFDGDMRTVMSSDQGFVVFEGGLPIVSDVAGRKVRVDAIYWDWFTDRHELHWWAFTADPALNRITNRDLKTPLTLIPKLGVGSNIEQYVIRVLAATWALSQQPTVTTTTKGNWDEKADGPRPRALRNAETRSPSPDVRLMYVRENLTNPTTSESDEPKREYTCRFIVRGHYRNQAYGPEHALHRRQWIPPFVKGPKDKPLKTRPVVHVWKG